MAGVCSTSEPAITGEAEILNVGKLRKGSELYYLNSVAKGVEDYYTGSGEAPGYWLASGTNELELSGTVTERELRAVLNGQDPRSGRRLAAAKATKRQRVPGFDLTFRAPKSVSLLHALGDKEASNEVVSAHDAAVAAALDYLERQASAARRGKGGKTRIASKGFVAAGFRHRSSRAGDPLLHTHVLVANLVKGEDGKWGALDARQIYLQAKTAGYLYQAQLRYELTRRLGLEWTSVRNGAADIAGIPRSVIRAFSRRRTEIEASVGEGHSGDAKAAQMAAILTRKAKNYDVTPERLLPEWRERAAKLGLTDEALADVIGRTSYRAPTAAARDLIAAALAGPAGLTEQNSTFTRRVAIQGFCNRLELGAPVADVETFADRFLASDRVVPLAARAEGLTAKDSIRVSDGRLIPGGVDEQNYSTAEMLSIEQDVIEHAIARRLDGCGGAQPAAVEQALAERPSLYPDQRAMVRRLTTTGQGVEVVVGRAGAGKTFALDAARDAWERSGRRVVGCSLSARAAEELQNGSGIPSFTITSLLHDIDDAASGGLAPNGVVVVDEAGMVGTRQLRRLLDHAARSNAKVVLVGDDRQLPEIEAGGAFRGIKNRLPAIDLSEVRRQPFGWERDALEMIRDGRSADAIVAYLAHERVVVARSSEETRRRLIADWWATQDDPEPAVMLAARRSDVADLNQRARAVMAVAGRLGIDELDVSGHVFAAGDRVMTLKNTRRLGLKNGSRATVRSVDLARRELTIVLDDGRAVTLPSSYLDAGHVTHAYAMTGHKAQGMTTDKAYVLGDQTLYREWTYVAMSRGRNDNRLYVVAGIDPERDELGGAVAGVDDPLKELIAAVGRSRAKDLALDSYEHEEIKNLDHAELRSEWEKARRLVDQMPPSVATATAHEAAEHRRLEGMLEIKRAQREDLQAELSALTRRDRKGSRGRGLSDRLAEATAACRTLDVALTDLQRSEHETSVARRAHETWLLRNAPTVRRLDALGRELWWREQQRALEAEVSMPRYLAETVGECPMKPSERAAWHEAVKAIESYRTRWGVDDAEVALGGDPEVDAQAFERIAARSAVDEVDAHREAGLERDRVL